MPMVHQIFFAVKFHFNICSEVSFHFDISNFVPKFCVLVSIIVIHFLMGIINYLLLYFLNKFFEKYGNTIIYRLILKEANLFRFNELCTMRLRPVNSIIFKSLQLIRIKRMLSSYICLRENKLRKTLHSPFSKNC